MCSTVASKSVVTLYIFSVIRLIAKFPPIVSLRMVKKI